MQNSFQKLQEAEAKAVILFQEIEKKNIIKPLETEESINEAIFDLANELFGIQKYWHKRIVRSGENTLYPYNENPPNLTIQEDDILFLDFGPIFEEWEADFGRTYVLGNDPEKRRLKNDIESAWYEIQNWFTQNRDATGADLYAIIQQKAIEKGWELGGEIAGHLIGHFPHEKLPQGQKHLYIHPENHHKLTDLDANGQPRHWILEIHFIDSNKKIGGFFEQLFF